MMRSPRHPTPTCPPDATRAVADALWCAGRTTDALTLGRDGLARHPADVEIARWLRDRAAALKQDAVSIEAAHSALRASWSVLDLDALCALAAPVDAGLRASVREEVRSERTVPRRARIELLLHLGLVEEAIEHARANDDPAVTLALVEASLDTGVRLGWTARACKARAAPIMTEARYREYDDAVAWLRRARLASRAANDEASWHRHIERLLKGHRHKWKLVRMLRALAEEP